MSADADPGEVQRHLVPVRLIHLEQAISLDPAPDLDVSDPENADLLQDIGRQVVLELQHSLQRATQSTDEYHVLERPQPGQMVAVRTNAYALDLTGLPPHMVPAVRKVSAVREGETFIQVHESPNLARH